MFNHAYSEAIEDEQGEARAQEQQAIADSIAAMEQSDLEPSHVGKRVEAIYFVVRLWSHLLNDLASGENASAPELKAGIISIGIFILRHVEKMRKDTTLTFAPVIEISNTILAGLKNE